VAQTPLAFSQVFAGLPGQATGTAGRDSIAIPDQQTVVDDAATSPYPVWRLTAQYVGGYKVVWHAVVYEAKWSNSGVDPTADGSPNSPAPWSVIGPVDRTETAPRPTTTVTGVTAAWDAGTLYVRGDRVLVGHLPYQARWSTKGDTPSTDYPIGPDEPWQALFTVPGEPANS
jgi:chitinase